VVSVSEALVPGATPAPRWYAHGLNRAAVYRVGAAVAAVLPRPLRLRAAQAVAAVIREGFDAYHGAFLEISRRAKRRFEQADWAGLLSRWKWRQLRERVRARR